MTTSVESLKRRTSRQIKTSHARNDNKTGIIRNQIVLWGEEEGWEYLRPDECDALDEADDFLVPIDELLLSLLPSPVFGFVCVFLAGELRVLV
jgi:hypothetical protein